MTQDTAASSDHHAPSVSVPLELSVCTLAVALGGCGQAKHPTVCLPQAFFRLERTAEEAAQNFTSPRVVPPPQHISGLPAEVRNALAHMCGDSQAEHQFARYSQNLRILVLHFEHFRCGDARAICTQAGCPHQVYSSTGGRYRLLRSYYAPDGD